MNILTTTLVAAGLLLGTGSASAAEKNEGFGSLTLDQVEGLIAQHGADIYDNNGHDEWKAGHVPTAKWVQFNGVKASDLPPDHQRKLVFYCANPH